MTHSNQVGKRIRIMYVRKLIVTLNTGHGVALLQSYLHSQFLGSFGNMALRKLSTLLILIASYKSKQIRYI